MLVALIDHKEDPKERIIRAAGDLDDFEIFNGIRFFWVCMSEAMRIN